MKPSHPRYHRREERLHLEPREIHAYAHVDGMAKSDRCVRRPMHIESVRIRKPALIPIRTREYQHYSRAGFQFDTREAVIARYRPRKGADGGREAHGLFDGSVNETVILPDEVPLIRTLAELINELARRGYGGIQARIDVVPNQQWRQCCRQFAAAAQVENPRGPTAGPQRVWRRPIGNPLPHLL